MAKTALTAEAVLMRCKVDRLESVQKMNVWGSNIDDVQVLRNMPNLEVVSLSVNKISSLKDFKYCPKIKELYLRKNLIADLSEVRYLQSMTGLKVLWLLENPCAEQPNYRLQVIKMLPTLDKLDNQAVTQEERLQTSSISEEPSRPQGSPPRREVARPKTSETASRPSPAVFVERPPIDIHRAPASRLTDETKRDGESCVSPAVNAERRGAFSVAERISARPGSSGGEKPPASRPRNDVRPAVGESRNENVFSAVLALLKELDEGFTACCLREVWGSCGRKLRGAYRGDDMTR